MRKNLRFLFALSTLLLILCTASSFSHPGRTDSKGGHYDNSDGSYHYHHGYPAHQHPGGVCPYESNYNNGNYGSDSNNDNESNHSYSYSSTSSSSNSPEIWPIYVTALIFALFYAILGVAEDAADMATPRYKHLNIGKNTFIILMLILAIPAAIMEGLEGILLYLFFATLCSYLLRRFVEFIYNSYKKRH